VTLEQLTERMAGRLQGEYRRSHRWADPSRLRLEILPHNQTGIPFWRAMGFGDYCLMLERPLQRPEA
jgi:hypothetical protein